MVYYCLKLSQPKELGFVQADDWISSIASSTENYYVISLFNGSLAYFNKENEKISEKSVSSKPIKMVKTMYARIVKCVRNVSKN